MSTNKKLATYRRTALLAGLLTVVCCDGTTAQDVFFSTANGYFGSNVLSERPVTEYIVGRRGQQFRNFSVFDLAGYDDPITSASLRFSNPEFAWPSQDTSFLRIYDVQTSVPLLLSPLSSPFGAIYGDLGSGTLLGSHTFSSLTDPATIDYVTVNLNAAGLAALNSATGSVALGGSLEDLVATGDHYFLRGTTFDPVELIVNGAAPPPPQIVQLSTEHHPLESFVKLEVFLGDPREDGALVGSVQRAVHGEVEAGMAVDGANVEKIWLRRTDLTMNNANGTLLNFGPLGTARVDLVGLGFDAGATIMPVDMGSFALPDAYYAEWYIGEGLGRIRNLTGGLAALFPGGFSAELDFAQTPFSINPGEDSGLEGIGGTADFGPGLFAAGPEVNLTVPAIVQPFETGLNVDFFLRVSGEFHVAAVPVPEPSSFVLGGIGAAGLAAGVCRARRRRGR